MDIQDLLRSEPPHPPSADGVQNPSLEVQQDREASSKRMKKCHICDKTLRGKDTLRRHIRSHDPNNRKFFCRDNSCHRKSIGFFRKQHLLTHEATVHGSSSSKLPIRRLHSDSDNGGELNELDNTCEATAERQFTAVDAQALASIPGQVVTDTSGNRIEAEQGLDSIILERLRSLEMQVEAEKNLNSIILERLRSLEMRVKSLERQRADT